MIKFKPGDKVRPICATDPDDEEWYDRLINTSWFPSCIERDSIMTVKKARPESISVYENNCLWLPAWLFPIDDHLPEDLFTL